MAQQVAQLLSLWRCFVDNTRVDGWRVWEMWPTRRMIGVPKEDVEEGRQDTAMCTCAPLRCVQQGDALQRTLEATFVCAIAYAA